MSIRVFTLANAVAVPAGAQPGTVDGPAIDLMDSDTYPTDPYVEVYHNTITATDASPGVFTWEGFPGADGDVVIVGEGAPDGFVAGEAYFVVNAATNTFDLSATLGGAAITTTSTGTAVAVELYHNEGGSGVTATPGAPFLPGYSAVLFLSLFDATTADAADVTIDIQGADAKADGTVNSSSWTTVASQVGNGMSMTAVSGQTVDGSTKPLYQFWRYVIVGSATAAAGTVSAFLVGT